MFIKVRHKSLEITQDFKLIFVVCFSNWKMYSGFLGFCNWISFFPFFSNNHLIYLTWGKFIDINIEFRFQFICNELMHWKNYLLTICWNFDAISSSFDSHLPCVLNCYWWTFGLLLYCTYCLGITLYVIHDANHGNYIFLVILHIPHSLEANCQCFIFFFFFIFLLFPSLFFSPEMKFNQAKPSNDKKKKT